MEENKIVIYQTEDGQTLIDVRLEDETVWLNVSQMSSLFDKEESNVRRHILNVFKEGELEKVENNVHFLHVNDVKKPVPFYSLDVIISVGYRVHSKRGTAFRIWARRIIKDYLVKGYAVNERIRKEQIGELRQLVGMLGRTIQNQPILSTDETNALFEVVTDYTYALDTLDNYDYERLTIDKTTKEEPFHATYENAMEAINGLREKFGGSALFGTEKDDSFKSSIGQIYQTFGGEELYPSVEVHLKEVPVTLFLCQRDDAQGWHTLLTTDLSLSFEQAYEIYARRWNIEVFFKECKQHLNLGRCQSYTFNAQVAATTISMMQYNLLATVKRFECYETLGGLFQAAGVGVAEATLTQRIWLIITTLIVEIANNLNLDEDYLMKNYLYDTVMFTKLINLEKPDFAA